MYTGDHQLRMQAEIGVMLLQAKDRQHPQSSEALGQPPGATSLANTLISDSWPPDYEINAFMLLNPPSSRCFVTAALTNTSTAFIMFPHNMKIRNFQKVTLFPFLSNTPLWTIIVEENSKINQT